MATLGIYKQVYYDTERRGFYYQLQLDHAEQGPFHTRASAIADASWTISAKYDPHRGYYQ